VVGRVSVGGGDGGSGGVETVILSGPYSTACWPARVDRLRTFV